MGSVRCPPPASRQGCRNLPPGLLECHLRAAGMPRRRLVLPSGFRRRRACAWRQRAVEPPAPAELSIGRQPWAAPAPPGRPKLALPPGLGAPIPPAAVCSANTCGAPGPRAGQVCCRSHPGARRRRCRRCRHGRALALWWPRIDGGTGRRRYFLSAWGAGRPAQGGIRRPDSSRSTISCGALEA